MTIAFTVAAIALLLTLIPAGIVICRGDLGSAVVAFEFATAVIVLVFIVIVQAFQRPSLFELPVLLALLMLGGGLVFVRALERWL
jgi:hypothetical protein